MKTKSKIPDPDKPEPEFFVIKYTNFRIKILKACLKTDESPAKP
jgi:hypothetical protein